MAEMTSMEQRAWQGTVGGLVSGIRGPRLGMNGMLRRHVMEEIGDYKDRCHYKKHDAQKCGGSHIIPSIVTKLVYYH